MIGASPRIKNWRYTGLPNATHNSLRGCHTWLRFNIKHIKSHLRIKRTAKAGYAGMPRKHVTVIDRKLQTSLKSFLNLSDRLRIQYSTAPRQCVIG